MGKRPVIGIVALTVIGIVVPGSSPRAEDAGGRAAFLHCVLAKVIPTPKPGIQLEAVDITFPEVPGMRGTLGLRTKYEGPGGLHLDPPSVYFGGKHLRTDFTLDEKIQRPVRFSIVSTRLDDFPMGYRMDKRAMSRTRLGDLMEPNQWYTVVLTEKRLSMARFGKGVFEDNLSKHGMLADGDPPLFAGTYWFDREGRLHLANDSGTFTPPKETLPGFAQYLHDYFGVREFVYHPYDDQGKALPTELATLTGPRGRARGDVRELAPDRRLWVRRGDRGQVLAQVEVVTRGGSRTGVAIEAEPSAAGQAALKDLLAERYRDGELDSVLVGDARTWAALPPELREIVPISQAQAYLRSGESGMHPRKATSAEVAAAMRARALPRTAESQNNAFVLQQKVDFAAPGTPVVLVGKPKLKAWNQYRSFEAMEHSLLSDDIVLNMPIRDYMSAEGKTPRGNSGSVFLIEFADGTRGVWKPGNLEVAGAEAAAYTLAKELGMEVVPPTLIREIDGVRGSIQYFVETPFDFKRRKSDIPKASATLSDVGRADVESFYFLGGNWDRHPGNQVFDGLGGVALIDNAEMKAQQHVRFGEPAWISFYDSGRPGSAQPGLKGGGESFPFDEGLVMTKPKVERLEAILGQDFTPETRKRIEGHLTFYQQEGAQIGFVHWQGKLWFRLEVPGHYPASVPRGMSSRTLARLRTLSSERAAELFPEPAFNAEWRRSFLNRRDQLVRAAETLPVLETGIRAGASPLTLTEATARHPAISWNKLELDPIRRARVLHTLGELEVRGKVEETQAYTRALKRSLEAVCDR